MTRTRDNSTHHSYIITRTSGIYGGSEYKSYEPVDLVNEQIMLDEVTPNFKRRSAAGEIIVSPMSRLTVTRRVLDDNFLKHNQSGYFQCDRTICYGSTSPWTESAVIQAQSRAEVLAITDAYANAGRADVEGLTELAELRETLAFLWSPVRLALSHTRRAKKIKRQYDRITLLNLRRKVTWDQLPERLKRKRKPPKPLPLPKHKWGITVYDIPSLWLAYRYALMPIVYTCDDISASLSRKVKAKRGTARAVETLEVDLYTDSGWRVSDNASGKSRERAVRTGKCTVKSRAGVLYEPNWSLDRVWGVQLHRVPATAYELIPLSFVADWFWNAASFYDALTVSCRVKSILASWVTSTLEFDVKGKYEAEPLDSYTSISFGNDYAVDIKATYRARRLTSLSDIRVAARVHLNTDRIADAFALIAEFLKSRR